MFGHRPLLGLGSLALGVASFQTPAHAGNFSVGFNLNLGPSRPAVVVPAPVQPSYYAPAPVIAQPVVPAPVIQPTYYTPTYSPSYRLPTPACDMPHHHHHGIQQSNYWRGGYQDYRYGGSPYRW